MKAQLMKAHRHVCLIIPVIVTVWTFGGVLFAQEAAVPKGISAPQVDETAQAETPAQPPATQTEQVSPIQAGEKTPAGTSSPDQQPSESPKAASDRTASSIPEKPAASSTDKAATSPSPQKPYPSSDKKAEALPNQKASKAQPALKKGWRRDKTIKRRPGSYLGGGMGYSMVNSKYTVKLKDIEADYDVGPVHGYMSFIRVGDALREWFAVGFQIDLIGATLAGTDEPGASAFGLYIDSTFYPWRGLGLRPSIGVGFGYTQAGKETYELGFGGPLSLSFAASYEFRVSKGFTMGPMLQISWVKGENFDAVFFNIVLEMLKWFKTAQG